MTGEGKRKANLPVWWIVRMFRDEIKYLARALKKCKSKLQIKEQKLSISSMRNSMHKDENTHIKFGGI